MDLDKKDIFKASITCPKEQVFFVIEDDVLGLQRRYFSLTYKHIETLP